MPKVITGAGLQEFISTGKHETIAAEEKKQAKGNIAEPLEVKKEAPVVEIDGNKAPEAVKEPEDGLEPEDHDLSEIIRKKIGKKHRAMKEAQEAAADAESFAKAQFDERRLIEGERDRLKRELDDAKKVQAPKEPELKEPQDTDAKYQVSGQFLSWKTYTKDVAEYSAKKAISDKEVKDRETAQRAAQEIEAAERAESAAKFKAKADRIDGFQERLAASKVVFRYDPTNAVLEYITESDDGPEIVMHLLDNPETADRISKLRPIKAIAEIGKLQKTFVQAKAVVNPQPPPVVIPERGGAPPPITPISGMGSGTVNTDPAKMSFRELREYERAKRKKH